MALRIYNREKIFSIFFAFSFAFCQFSPFLLGCHSTLKVICSIKSKYMSQIIQSIAEKYNNEVMRKFYMGNAKECELAVLLLDRRELLPVHGACSTRAEKERDSPGST